MYSLNYTRRDIYCIVGRLHDFGKDTEQGIRRGSDSWPGISWKSGTDHTIGYISKD